MPQGLQIFDANGNVQLDTNAMVARMVGAIYLSGTSSGSQYMEGLKGGRPFFVIIPTEFAAVPSTITFGYGANGIGNGYVYWSTGSSPGYLYVGVY